jgi:hypothetical protein
MMSTKAGPCPVCGSLGLIPDGVYKYANHAISLLTFGTFEKQSWGACEK